MFNKKNTTIAIIKPRGHRPLQKKESAHRINDDIIGVENIRLVGDNIEQGIYSVREALIKARELELDLVEISPNTDPPVCRILNYSRYIYEQKKKQKEMLSNSTKVIVKEVRFTPNTDEHDYEFKKKHAFKFLKEGSKLKAYVFFRGRQMAYTKEGEILLLKLAQDLEECGKVEQMPKLEGRNMIMIMAPKITKK